MQIKREVDFLNKCNSCPRNCVCDRERSLGFCKMPDRIFIAKYMLHQWEEPCLCGDGGAGTIFFSGCNLRCVFCQNKKISRGIAGEEYTPDQVLDIIRSLANDGAKCIEFVTPTHFSNALIPILQKAKREIDLPFVWNSGGYESVETLRRLEGLIDIYMPDIKYFSGELSRAYSNAENYYPVARAALCEMLRQVGRPQFDKDGMLRSGVIMRHLVLPACRKDSIALLNDIASTLDSPSDVILSLMSQYTPEFYDISDGGHKNLCRRLTDFEYTSVLQAAESLGFEGYFQGRESADTAFTPKF